MTKEEQYKKVALELLGKYISAEETVIGEFSGDFKNSARMLKKEVLKYLKKLDMDESYFDTLAAERWLWDTWNM